MLATPTTGLLLAARLLLPRAIDGQARKPGTGRPATPPEQGCAWGVSWPVLGDPAKSRLLVEPAGHPVGSGGSEVGSAVGTARSGRGCSARAGLTGVEWSRLRAELHRYPVY
jgi:hypothetical protein